MENVGAALFGLVIGWVTYRTLRRSEDKVALSDIAAVIGAVGGAAITQLFDDKDLFAWYSVGLAVGFFAYFVIGLILEGPSKVSSWMGPEGHSGGDGGSFGRPS